MDNSAIFAGSSRYAQDFQAVIDRAVAIASLPITQLTSQKQVLGDKQAAYVSLGDKMAAVRDGVQALVTAIGGSSYTSLSSDATVATATVSSGALEGTYSIQVVDAGASTRMLSNGGPVTVSDPTKQSISTAASFTLTVDGVATTVKPATNTLSDLANAINAAGAGVTATIVNIGPPSTPDYRLVLQSADLANVPITLSDGSQELLEVMTEGKPALYRVNGQPSAAIATESRAVTVAPGVTVNLLKAGTSEIQVQRNTAAVSTGLQTLIAAYNAAVGALDTHRGEGTGALKGDSAIQTLTGYLRSLINYTAPSGNVRSVADLGLRFDEKGKLSLDTAEFAKLSVEDIETFLGDGTKPGFLKSASDILKAVDDATSGIVPTAITSLTSQISRQDELIAANQERVNLLAESLNAKMAAADALIASLEQQVMYFTSLFDMMRSNSENMG